LIPERRRVLITVKTYPLPSESYLELVCTAGVREDGSFIRLFPIDYRYQPYYKWYHKYQWIEVTAVKNAKDPRPETFRPDMATLKVLGKPLDTKNNWHERKRYVLAQGTSTMCGLQSLSQTQRSLGIIRPREVTDFRAELVERDWKPRWKTAINQLQLLGPQRKPLEKIPYKFSYVYKCEEPACKGHSMMVEDWEICELYRAMRDKYRNEEVAIEKVKQKYLSQICDPAIDTHFYVGTVLQHGTWVILGVFWPKKSNK
jgi:hypothetical protein